MLLGVDHGSAQKSQPSKPTPPGSWMEAAARRGTDFPCMCQCTCQGISATGRSCMSGENSQPNCALASTLQGFKDLKVDLLPHLPWFPENWLQTVREICLRMLHQQRNQGGSICVSFFTRTISHWKGAAIALLSKKQDIQTMMAKPPACHPACTCTAHVHAGVVCI